MVGDDFLLGIELHSPIHPPSGQRSPTECIRREGLGLDRLAKRLDCRGAVRRFEDGARDDEPIYASVSSRFDRLNIHSAIDFEPLLTRKGAS